MPKLYTYFLVVDGTTTTELTTDPKGWQEHSIAFSRTDDFGLNIEHTIPLSFSREGREIIKNEFENKGVFADVKCIIKKRNNDWTVSTFYEYKLDFTTYNDNIQFIEITGTETGLLSKLMAYRDTEYDIALPTSGKSFMNYDGITINKKNLIQCGYGATIELPHEDWYSPIGYRSGRTYNDKISFVDSNGLPWKNMMFQVLEAGTYRIRVKLNLKIRIQYPFGGFTSPASKPMWLLKHNANMTSFVSGDVLYEFAPTHSDSNSFLSRRTDEFIGYDITSDYSISLDKPYVSLVYPQNNGTYLKVAEVREGFNTFIEISNDVASPYQNMTLEYVTHQWLIQQLLNKIYPSNTLTYNLTHTNYLPALISDDCIRNLNKTDGTGKFTVKLSDVLKSLDVLECIGIDITGSTMTISPRANMYSGTKYKTVTSKDISVKADISNVFNRINVGWDTAKRDKDSDLSYPFNCKKTFEVVNSPVESELDLVHPFIGDCYEIEKHFDDIINSETNSNKSDICVIALTTKFELKLNPNIEYYGAGTELSPETIYDIQIRSSDEFAIPSPKIIITFDNEFNQISNVRNGIFKFTASSDGVYNFHFEMKFYGIDLYLRYIKFIKSVYFDTSGWTSFNEYEHKESTTSYLYGFNGSVSLLKDDTFTFAGTLEVEMPDAGIDEIIMTDLTLNFNSYTEGNIYKSHELTNFNGIANTVFNVPITPKRILNKHLSYISASCFGSTDYIDFVSSELESAIISKCDFESSPIVENSDVAPVTPMFLPALISFETQEQLNSLADVQTNKYKYIEVQDEKTGKIYTGWINNITFAVGKNKSQEWEIQARNI